MDLENTNTLLLLIGEKGGSENHLWLFYWRSIEKVEGFDILLLSFGEAHGYRSCIVFYCFSLEKLLDLEAIK
jgi:hypothetical protein